ncbi:hypothetical protein Ahy_B05g077614 isoform B [Arachis hypogaea]|uniref:Uncharacterized protein n=1 Tax=Arachis hypogaea TaxID=3818 RepID=A0A444Z548_ARAHY|nr:hypothetical protein Ahy_B05g077614 isoform B [Arachis hypogaea]
MLYCCTKCTIVFPCCLGCKTFSKDSRNGKEESNLVFVLIDEVESLAAVRKAAISSSEPDVRKTIRHKTHRQVYRVASSNKTHGSEVDPTRIEGLSNFSLVVDLVKRIKCWLSDL